MRIFDPHYHATSRTTTDYEALYAAGVRAVLEPAFWLGQPRTNSGSFADYFDALIGWEPYRAAQFGIQHRCALALNPKEAGDLRFADDVLDMLPAYLAKDAVVAVGEVGYDSATPQEDKIFAAQVQLAVDFDLPVLVHTPHRDKLSGTRRTLALLRESGIPAHRVLIDHLNEATVPEVIDTDHWMGFSIYPDTKMDPARMARLLTTYGTTRMLVNSAADWGRSDPLTTVRTAHAMLGAGFTMHDVDQVMWRNPVAFYDQSGRLDLPAEPPRADSCPQGARPDTYLGNSVRRGD